MHVLGKHDGDLSLPTPIRRNAKSPSCLPNTCIDQPTFCLCGFEKTPDDLCCDYKCNSCPANYSPWKFEIGPLNFFPSGPLNFTGLSFTGLNFTGFNFPILGRR